MIKMTAQKTLRRQRLVLVATKSMRPMKLRPAPSVKKAKGLLPLTVLLAPKAYSSIKS